MTPKPDRKTAALRAAWVQRLKLWAEADKLRAEDAKLLAEGAVLRADGDLVWAAAVLSARGNVTMEWLSPTHCVLGTGEEFGASSTQKEKP